MGSVQCFHKKYMNLVLLKQIFFPIIEILFGKISQKQVKSNSK